MERVQEQVEHHYHSSLVESVRGDGAIWQIENTTHHQTKQLEA